MENLEENITQQRQCTVICINLDNFRRINDIYGLTAGDELIKAYAERLEEIVSDNDFVARITGDEFAVILDSRESNQDIINFVGKIQGIFNIPVNVEGNNINVSASIGVAVFPRDASGAEEMLRCSEKAMFMSKNNGKNKVCFYSPIV
ncbi:MAG: GGDEF domain-containing protein [Ruminococcus sp.]|nr:GGDEF domain-containing protein [Ruminococcus sp.]